MKLVTYIVVALVISNVTITFCSKFASKIFIKEFAFVKFGKIPQTRLSDTTLRLHRRDGNVLYGWNYPLLFGGLCKKNLYNQHDGISISPFHRLDQWSGCIGGSLFLFKTFIIHNVLDLYWGSREIKHVLHRFYFDYIIGKVKVSKTFSTDRSALKTRLNSLL